MAASALLPQSVLRPLLALAVMILLAGCASRVVGVMKPVGQPANPKVSEVQLLAATTRAPSSDKAILFTGERGSGLMVDAVTVSIPPDKDRKIGEVEWPRQLPPDPLKSFTTVAVQPILSESQGHEWLHRTYPGKRRVLVFVHGFNTTYEESVYRFAQIVHDSKADVVPVIFTWPSRGSIFDYNYDKDSTNYSRDALEDMLTRIVHDPGVGDVTVMAHSMGSWLAVEALRQMAIRHGRVNPKITNVILASPDIDVDVFGKQFAALGPHKPHFTLFVSRDDRALGLSKLIAGNVTRLGQINPAQEPYRSRLEAAGITVLDLTKLQTGDRINHTKFAESPEVVRLIGNRLIAGQTVTDSDVGVGDALGAVAIGAGKTIGQAAGAAVSAPILIFDPRTRRNYGDQWRQLGANATSTVETVGVAAQ